MFVKAPLRVQKYKQLAPSLPLPPQPVLTRWGTWLDAAEYYCENYAVIEEIVNTFDSSDAFSITIVKELFSSSLSGSLAYIKSNYGGIATTISRLSAVGTDLNESLELIKGVRCDIGRARGKIGDAVKSKLNTVLRRNDGYATMCKISDILSGNEATLGVDEPALNSNDLTLFKYAPVTSCDVERSFSSCKCLILDQHQMLRISVPIKRKIN